ncbi:MAG: hypothetical protein KGJ43_09520, partial [Acidobacteriota bacterium]|nr:hypothetical protein [Acidobacteriota bacterium]
MIDIRETARFRHDPPRPAAGARTDALAHASRRRPRILTRHGAALLLLSAVCASLPAGASAAALSHGAWSFPSA